MCIGSLPLSKFCTDSASKLESCVYRETVLLTKWRRRCGRRVEGAVRQSACHHLQDASRFGGLQFEMKIAKNLPIVEKFAGKLSASMWDRHLKAKQTTGEFVAVWCELRSHKMSEFGNHLVNLGPHIFVVFVVRIHGIDPLALAI